MFKKKRMPPRDDGERLIDAWEQAVIATIAENTRPDDPAAAIDATRATREAAAQLRQDYRRERSSNRPRLRAGHRIHESDRARDYAAMPRNGMFHPLSNPPGTYSLLT
jgi:hypothetical protein